MHCEDSMGLRVRLWTISPPARSSRNDDLQNTFTMCAAQGRNIRCEFDRKVDSQSIASVAQSLQVRIEKAHLAVSHQRSLEKSIAVIEAAIVHGHCVCRILDRDTVVQSARCHGASPVRARSTPRALARDSSSSRSGIESATI